MSEKKKEYLGDGVYASFDGDSIWLAVNTPTNDVVALNWEVLVALMQYANKLRKMPEEQVYSPYQEL